MLSGCARDVDDGDGDDDEDEWQKIVVNMADHVVVIVCRYQC